MHVSQEIREFDDAGRLSTSYVRSGGIGQQRVDVLRHYKTWSLRGGILDVFLPAGFPSSVTEDYVQYQVYDSLQAFVSTIAGLLASRAVLEGVGVGDASASPTAAMLLSILQESTGRLATIAFAHRFGTKIEPECKMYRLAADVFNDAAMILDCLSPGFPRLTRVVLLSSSSMLRALCGVAAGSAKASLSAHFACWGNLGELNAKDSSQETVISLLGMLCGSFVVSHVKSLKATWATLLILLAIHLYANFAAVKAVQMRSLNRQRANIVLSYLSDTGKVLAPSKVAKQELIFERDGVLRWRQSASLGHGVIGVKLDDALRAMALHDQRTGSFKEAQIKLEEWYSCFTKCRYLLWFDPDSKMALIVLKRGASASDQLQAWMQALIIAKQARVEHMTVADMLSQLHTSLRSAQALFEAHKSNLEAVGWDLQTAAMEVRPGARIEVVDSDIMPIIADEENKEDPAFTEGSNDRAYTGSILKT